MRNRYGRDRGGNYDEPRDEYRDRGYERDRDWDERNRGEFSGTPRRSSGRSLAVPMSMPR